MNFTRIAIAGGSGKLGETLYNLLINEVENVVSIFTTNKNFVDQYHPKSLFIRSPLDFKEFKKDIISLEPHFIINAVGMNGVSECESNKKHAWELNTIVSENIAKAAKITNSTVILISTDRVFNGQ